MVVADFLHCGLAERAAGSLGYKGGPLIANWHLQQAEYAGLHLLLDVVVVHIQVLCAL